MDKVSIKQIHMNCSWTIEAYPQALYNRLETESLINEAFSIIKNVESNFSIFKESDFNKININAGIRPTIVDEETWELLNKSKYYFEKTKNKFDITYRSKCHCSFNDIELNELEKSIFLPKREMFISLGGIGKGYAIDKAYNFLRSRGLKNFKVNGSGDIRLHSSEDAPRKWKIGITNPFNPKNTIGVLYLTNESLATSGTYKKGKHIKSSTELISATILSDNALDCDVIGTTALTMSENNALDFLNDNNYFAVLINGSGKVLLSKKAKSSFYKYTEKYNEISNSHNL